MKILICGLPGSGKTTLAKPFAELIGAIHLNADDIRNKYNDWDFTPKGRLRQTLRMSHLADGILMADKIAVADFVCPTEITRDWFKADYIVWMDTLEKSEYEDTNTLFEKPSNYNYHVKKWFDNTHAELVKVVKNYILHKEGKPTERL